MILDSEKLNPQYNQTSILSIILALDCSSRSSKVIDFGTNRKRIYDFLLVINSNICPILHRFWDTATYWLKIDIQYLLLAIMDVESAAEHGAAKLPVAVQVNVYAPAVKFTILEEEMTAPVLSVHW